MVSPLHVPQGTPARALFSCLAAMLIATGCGVEAEYKSVDFSKTVPVPHPEPAAKPSKVLQVAVAAMISPKETFNAYRDLLEFIGTGSGFRLHLVQRKTYDEVNDLFQKGQIDLAFICTGPYATGRDRFGFEALAVPQVRGAPFYQSYLIVRAESGAQKLEDLRGGVFAFTDPDSNTGALVPRYWLSLIGESPESFFLKTTFTYSHDNSIMAVARGMADGAAVDGHQWEYFQRFDPTHTSRTRVIRKSEPFGSPPVVASARLPREVKTQIQNLLLSMHQRPEGKRILDQLLIDRFLPPREEWYAPVRAMIADIGRTRHASQKP